MNKLTPSAKTWDEWKALGYQVLKGQKATSFTRDGKARFDREQVSKLYTIHSVDDETEWDMDDFYGHPDYYDAVENIEDKD